MGIRTSQRMRSNDSAAARRERLLRVALRYDLVSRFLEQERERLPEPGIVVNDEHMHRSHLRAAGRP